MSPLAFHFGTKGCFWTGLSGQINLPLSVSHQQMVSALRDSSLTKTFLKTWFEQCRAITFCQSLRPGDWTWLPGVGRCRSFLGKRQGRVSQQGPVPPPQPRSRTCQRAVAYTAQGFGLELMWCKTHKICIVLQGFHFRDLHNLHHSICLCVVLPHHLL